METNVIDSGSLSGLPNLAEIERLQTGKSCGQCDEYKANPTRKIRDAKWQLLRTEKNGHCGRYGRTTQPNFIACYDKVQGVVK